jgi:peptide-methionine (R)-S-oxide reductase
MLEAPHQPNESHEPRRVLSRGKLLAGIALALLAGAAVAALVPSRDKALPAVQKAESDPPPATPTTDKPMSKVNKTDAEWKAQLSDEQYEVTRRKGTERAFTGKYWNNKDAGTYKCVCCGAVLFTSDTKYDSGCGWPSFFAPSKPENFHNDTDLSHGMVRTEVTCSQCGAHLGHLFDDGPQPTGQRYCMNSASLDFEKKSEADPSGAKKPSEPQ